MCEWLWTMCVRMQKKFAQNCLCTFIYTWRCIYVLSFLFFRFFCLFTVTFIAHSSAKCYAYEICHDFKWSCDAFKKAYLMCWQSSKHIRKTMLVKINQNLKWIANWAYHTPIKSIAINFYGFFICRGCKSHCVAFRVALSFIKVNNMFSVH